MMTTKEFFPVAQSSVDLCFRGARMTQPPAQPVKKSRRGPRSKSSQYRGVTFYRRTGRWESHIWDCGKQVYLGGFDTAHAAARAYDRAAVKFRGLEADINFIISDYEEDLKQMANLSKEEVVQLLRRQSSGFSRNNSRYQGFAMQKILSGNMVAATKWSGREVASLIEPHASRMIPEAAANVKLDLSLGISLSLGDGPKQKDKAPRLHQALNSILCGRNSMMENYMAPAFFSPMERTPEKGFMSHSLHQSFSARTWKAQDATTAAIASPLYSNAASSGFSHSATRPPSSSTATLQPSQPFLNLNIPGLYVIHPSDHSSQQHHHLHHMNRPQPPP